MKKLFAVALALIMLMQFTAPTGFAKTKTATKDEPKYYVSFEGLTLGQGMYVEPKAYTLSEVNALIESEGLSVTEEDITAAMVTLACFKDNGIEFQNGSSGWSSFYLAAVKDFDKGYIDIPEIIQEASGYTNDTTDGNSDEWLGEFDYTSMSGWMIMVDDEFIDRSAGAYEVSDTSLMRWCFTIYGYGADLGVEMGWGMPAPYTHANKDALYKLFADINYQSPEFFENNSDVKTKALSVMEKLDATDDEVAGAVAELTAAYESGAAQDEPLDVSNVLNASLEKLANTVPEPKFGTLGGEWAVLCLARGEYYEKDSEYFKSYYDRIVDTVNETAASVNLNGALHKTKSTENSRLIIALSSIGKNARSVGDWNLIAPYEDFTWITKQGINGPIFALLALDTIGYTTEDETIRTQCIEYILGKELANGGWAFSGTSADPDITSMAVYALAPYVDENEAVNAAVERAVSVLSALQNDNGGFNSWGSENAESCAQVIVACTSVGINPDTDERFVKDGHSAVDALLSYYVESDCAFSHVPGGTVNAMATDQAIYALVSYKRIVDGKTSLFDMSDVNVPTYDENGFMNIDAIITAPAIVSNSADSTFNAQVALTNWDTEKEYKILDAIVAIPDGVTVKGVTANANLSGGEMYYALEEQTGKLRIVYADLENYSNITVTSDVFPAEIFTIELALEKVIDAESIDLAVTGMSLKLGADSSDPAMLHVMGTADAVAGVALKKERAVFAYRLYKGDGIDLIAENMQAVAVLVTETDGDLTVSFGGKKLLYNEQISEKTGVATFIAMFDTEVTMDELNTISNYEFKDGETSGTIEFCDVNYDGVVNAQDALNTVNAWLRKGSAPDENTILAMNVNCDSRINTFDALGIVDSFVNGTEPIIVTYGATLGAE